ncbi:ompA-family membrane domain protein, partial [Yersinia pestis PY-48]
MVGLRIAGDVGVTRHHDQPAGFGFDVDQRRDQHFG